ncbi:hypothetical protein VM1G_00101 [Cytospora mali]|uniref:Uncharacterized protein n=1 Tax=Cytospora mali TaxID=578113 RepID=A0A194VLX2_CYTMA|nr:hypothetical protein VM1G_00101 [Valsa mali]
MAALTDRQSARKLVQQISSDHGYLSEEELRVFSPEQRHRVENALRKKDELIWFSIITLLSNMDLDILNLMDSTTLITVIQSNGSSKTFGEAPSQGEDEPSYRRLLIHGQYGKEEPSVYKPHCRCMFIADDDPYGPSELFKATSPGSTPGSGAKGFSITFVHEEYFITSPENPPDQELTWLQWFHRHLAVEKYFSFPRNKSGSWIFGAEYLQRERPEEFLAALLRHYQHNPEPGPEFIKCVQNTKVLCRGNYYILLKEAYFPTRKLENAVQQYVEPNAFFPWLWLDTNTTYDYIPTDWKAKLTTYHIPSTEDMKFALAMLQYSAIYMNEDTANRLDQRAKIRNAPHKMTTMLVLRLLYEPYFAHGPSQDQTESVYLREFFTSTLGIGDCSWQIHVDELYDHNCSGFQNVDTITVIYQELRTLYTNIITDMEKEEFRNAFESRALIFVPSDDGPSWHKASQCVWSTAASLRGRISLNEDYEELKDFLVEFLGVKPVTLHMAIDQLRDVELFELLMTHPVTHITEAASEKGASTVKAILFTPISRVSTALEDCGIGIVSVDNVDEAVEQVITSPEAPAATILTRTTDDDTQALIPGSDQDDINSVLRDIDTPTSSIQTLQQASAFNSGMDGFDIPIRSAPTTVQVDDRDYIALLSRVITAGRSSRLPHREESTVGYLQGQQLSTGIRSYFEVFGATTFERDCKIGAAGELYVFELLSHLVPELPYFSTSNWQSTIRRYVKAHPDYAHMAPWTGWETSDITYRDVNGILTDFLIS